MKYRKITYLGFYVLTIFMPDCASLPPPDPSISLSVEPSREAASTSNESPNASTSSETSPSGLGITDRELSLFNQFVLSGSSDRESNPLISRCKKNPKDNPFCFTILTRNSLEEKRRQYARRNQRQKFGSGNGRPIIRDGVVANWETMRNASVNSMIRTFSKMADDRLLAIKDAALKESTCPNNPAIAIAATLEDLLPSLIDPMEIALLYQKGGECINQAPVEQEIILTRAGLFYFLKKDFKQASNLFERAKDTDVPYTWRPLYWLARSYKEMGRNSESEKIIEFLRKRYPFSFHTLVALTADKSDPGDILKSNPESLSKRRSEQNPNVNALIDQVELLQRFGYSASASRVLDWAAAESQGFEPEVRLYLAELKQGGTDRVSQISLLSDILYRNPQLVSRQSMDLYFPKAFYPVFESNIAGIDPNLLLAVARQESAFNPRARSVANARGLMQILPKTGKRFKKRLDLYDPSSNVEVGSRYLFELLKRLSGNIPMALASYNAGPERVSNWSKRYPVEDPVLFTDLIPFRETREYVASILRNYYWYRRLNPAGDENFVDLVFEAQIAERNVTTQPTEN